MVYKELLKIRGKYANQTSSEVKDLPCTTLYKISSKPAKVKQLDNEPKSSDSFIRAFVMFFKNIINRE